MLTSDDAKQRKRDEEAAAALVRQRDRDRYWSALFAPRPKRPAILALYAFNAELDHILASVSEPMAGQIRLQWWRDAVDLATPGARTGNPVADALSAAIAEHNLSKDRLIGMVDARVPAMFGEPPLDDKALKTFLRETEGAVFELAAAILGDRSESAKAAAAHAGVAYGLTEIASQASFPGLAPKGGSCHLHTWRAGGLIWLPSTGARQAKASGLPSPTFGVSPAGRCSNSARWQVISIRSAWPAFLPLTLVKPYLRAMAAPDFDPLHTVVAISPFRRFWRIWRAARRHTL